MPEYTGPEEIDATNPPQGRHPMAKQMGGLEPYESDEPLVTFLYLLLRQCVHPGDVEQAVCEVEQGAERVSLLSNAFLAEYAQNISDRLVRATELRVKVQHGELRKEATGGDTIDPTQPADVPAPASAIPLSDRAEADNEESREHARMQARAGAEGRLRAWVNAPMTIPLARVVEQAFAAIGTSEERANLSEVLETVTILTELRAARLLRCLIRNVRSRGVTPGARAAS